MGRIASQEAVREEARLVELHGGKVDWDRLEREIQLQEQVGRNPGDPHGLNDPEYLAFKARLGTPEREAEKAAQAERIRAYEAEREQQFLMEGRPWYVAGSGLRQDLRGAGQ